MLRGRCQEHLHIVIITLAIHLHVEADGNVRTRANRKQFLGRHHRGGVRITWVGAVVGHKQSTRTVVGTSHPVVWTSSVVQNPRIAGTAEVGRIRKGGGRHGRGGGQLEAVAALVTAAAVSLHIEVIRGTGRQSGDSGGWRVLHLYRGTRTLCESHGAIFHNPVMSGTRLRPAQGDGGFRGIRGSQVGGSRTGGDGLQQDVVNIDGIGDTRICQFQCHVGTLSRIAAQIHLLKFKCTRSGKTGKLS